MSEEQANGAEGGENISVLGTIALALDLDGASPLADVFAKIDELKADAAAVAAAVSQQADYASVIEERDRLRAELDQTKTELGVIQRALPPKPRKIGPVNVTLAGDALAEMLKGDVELAFSDGKREVAGLAPVGVNGAAAWSRRGSGFLLRRHVDVRGAAIGQPAYQIHGIGLLIEGKQVAWCPLEKPVAVPGGQAVQFRDSIMFG